MRLGLLIGFLPSLLAIAGPLSAVVRLNPAGGGEYRFPHPSICLSDAQRKGIQQMLRQNERLLEQKNIFFPKSQQTQPLFFWPIRQAPGFKSPGFWGTAYFVDHNPSYPNQVLDYNGGDRTYDTDYGYNHQGTDLSPWPFDWAKYFLKEIRAVAAAPGVIIGKDDGHFDRNCSFNPPDNTWNAVFIRQDDGSQTWYGHLRRGSLTAKQIGQRVEKGEELGAVGSSGLSTAPHLHLEVYDAAGKLIDPYAGPYNQFNTESWWNGQRPYRDPAVNQIMTHSSPPRFWMICGRIETINATNQFRPGQNAVFAAYYRDQLAGQPSIYKVFEPTGKQFVSWSHASPQDFSFSYWYWTFRVPNNAPEGVWKFQVSFQGKTYIHNFSVGNSVERIHITGIHSNTVKTGTEGTLTVSGIGFREGMAVSIYRDNNEDDPAIDVRSIVLTSETQILVRVAAQFNAAAGSRTIILTRPDYLQTSMRNAFQVVK